MAEGKFVSCLRVSTDKRGGLGLKAQRGAVRPMIGMASRAIAAKLSEMGIETPRGGTAWSHKTVQRVMARLGFLERPRGRCHSVLSR